MEKVNTFLNILGISYGISFINSLLGIILLVLNISSILITMIISIINKFKNKKYKDILEDIDYAKDKIEELKGEDKNEL